MPSLRDFLAELPEDEILRIDDPIARDFVPTAMVLELEKSGRSPVLVLNHLEGSDMPVVANLFGDRGRIARIAGARNEDFNGAWLRVLDNLMPPRLSAGGPIHESIRLGNEVDVTTLPVSRHFAQDAGQYVNAGILVCKDPDTGVRNLSFQRLQVKGPARFATNLGSRGHIWEHLHRTAELGRDLPVAVVIGAHPAVYLAASAKVALEVDEYDIAGSLLGHPLDLVKCRTVDLEVPAEAEIVIEGELLSREHEDEGPYGEYTGYASHRSTRNILRVTAITQRAKPIYLDIISGNSSEHLLLGGMAKEAIVFNRLREMVPGVRALNYPKSGTHFHAYLSLKTRAAGEARQALMLLLGLDSYIKLAIAVDDDIDVFNEDEVMWAVATRFQAKSDMFMVPDVLCNRVDPSADGGVCAKLAVDATVGSNWDAERATVPPAAADAARGLLGAGVARRSRAGK